MADDRILINATNETFWQITGYKPGQRLNMSIAADRQMAKTWLDIYAQIRGHRERATQTAQRTRNEVATPYILVIEHADGSLAPQAFQESGDLDVQFVWQLGQPETYTYLAAFDFSKRSDAPVIDQFALSVRKQQQRQQQAATSGWRRW